MDMDGDMGPTYMNDLLNRVDSTLGENRSAYGGAEHSEEGNESWAIPEVQAQVLWGDENDNLDRESRLFVIVLFLGLVGALSFSFCKSAELIWFLQWLLVTLLAHLAAVGLRYGLTQAEDLDGRRRIIGVCAFGILVWIIAAMATCTQSEIGSGFLLWFAVITLGAIVVESSARIVLHFFSDGQSPRFLGGTPGRHLASSASDDHLQYAAL